MKSKELKTEFSHAHSLILTQDRPTGCQGGQIDTPWEYISQSGAVSGAQQKNTMKVTDPDPFATAGFCSAFSLPHCHHHGPQVHLTAALVSLSCWLKQLEFDRAWKLKYSEPKIAELHLSGDCVFARPFLSLRDSVNNLMIYGR